MVTQCDYCGIKFDNDADEGIIGCPITEPLKNGGQTVSRRDLCVFCVDMFKDQVEQGIEILEQSQI